MSTASPTAKQQRTLSFSLGEGQPLLEMTPLVPKSRTCACLDLSSASMQCAWQQVEQNFTSCDDDVKKKALALDEFRQDFHLVVDKGLECPEVGKDVHKKCRCAGVPLCKDNNFTALKAHLTRAFRDICQSQNKGAAADGKGNIYKQQMFGLSNGFWVVALHGETVGSPSGHSEQQEEVKHEFLWLHISHVLGGLQQFHPLFTRMALHLPESGVVETDDGLVWPEKAELHLGRAFGSPFCDYTELLCKLDIDKKWSIHIYELADSERIVGVLNAGQIQVEKKKEMPPYVAWQGAAAYKRSRPSSRPATSRSKNNKQAGLAATLFDLEDEPTESGQSRQPEHIPAKQRGPNKSRDEQAKDPAMVDLDLDEAEGDDFDPWSFPDDDCNPGNDVDDFLWDYFCNEAAEVEDDMNPSHHAAAAADSGPPNIADAPPLEPSSGSKEQPQPAEVPDDTPLEMLLPGARFGGGSQAVPADVAAHPAQPRTSRDYVGTWTDVLCSQCGNVAGQIKLDPGPAGRDPKTWFMRVKEDDGITWGHKYPKFRRRVVTIFGDTDKKPKEWVQENRHCCPGPVTS